VWQLYKEQLASFWVADEIDFSEDRDQWENVMTEDERRFVKHVLAFFAGTDTIVSLNLMDNFCKEVNMLEAQVAYTYQAMMENIHGEVYSMMIDTYIQDPDEKRQLFLDTGAIASVGLKMRWAEQWSLNAEDAPFAKRLVAFAVVEGLFFSGAFCAIYWLKQRNLLKGLTFSNELIQRDESMHTSFACLMYSKLAPEERMAPGDVHALLRDAVEVEKQFITESIPCRLIGMNADLMAQYIEFVADSLLGHLGCAAIYHSRNPFSFMNLIGLPGRANFFEKRPSDYQRADVLNVGKDMTFGGAENQDF